MVDNWLNRVKTGLEILAIVGAAGWVIWHFGISEEPSLGIRFNVESSINWYNVTDRVRER